MNDTQVRVTTVVAFLFGVLSLGLVVGAWWLSYLGWFAMLCGQGVVFALLSGVLNRQARMTHAMWNSVTTHPGGRLRVLSAENREPPRSHESGAVLSIG